jgi:hypothetical protein
MRAIEIDSVWKASDGRLLRVVSIEVRRIGVRNTETGRLSYMQRRYFENDRAGVGWWLEPASSPLLESATTPDAVDPSVGTQERGPRATETSAGLLGDLEGPPRAEKEQEELTRGQTMEMRAAPPVPHRNDGS